MTTALIPAVISTRKVDKSWFQASRSTAAGRPWPRRPRSYQLCLRPYSLRHRTWVARAAAACGWSATLLFLSSGTFLSWGTTKSRRRRGEETGCWEWRDRDIKLPNKVVWDSMEIKSYLFLWSQSLLFIFWQRISTQHCRGVTNASVHL